MKTAAVYKQQQHIADIVVAGSFLLRLRGLIGRPLAAGQGLLLKPCRQIHTFFMSYAIDAVYLDRSLRIVDIEAELPARRICKARRGAFYVLELSAGEQALKKLRIGDILSIE
ncbi:MAG: DUF192 domain-containing protein [Bacillota bacterium]|nr:DUF192 domain-containing protein [Bacillota bacterium]